MKNDFKHFYFLLLLAFSLGLVSCSEEKKESVESAEPVAQEEVPLPQSDENRIIFRDRSGATLTVETGNRSPKAYLAAGSTEDFQVPVRIRFQGNESDSLFRKNTEMEPDEEDYWTYDDEKNEFEVGWGISFLRSLALADRVFLEVRLSDTERKALVFDVEERNRELLSLCLRWNEERVDQEMRRLGLGKYALESAKKQEKPDPLAMDLDEEALFVLYEEYISSVAEFSRDEVLPPAKPEERARISESYVFKRPVTSTIAFYSKAYPEAVAKIEKRVIDRGFETLEQWTHIGDRIQIAMAALALDEKTKGDLEEVRGYTADEIESFEQGKREYVELIQAFSDEEIEWFAREFPRFRKAIGK